jgi:hypothetical protein
MQVTDTFWHIANFFAPAIVVGLLAAAMTKVIWRRELAGIGWLRLAAWAGAAMALVSMAGLVIFERDGKMITYAAMLLACAVALWWAGFRRGGRR